MPSKNNIFPRYYPVGDSALLLELGESLQPEINNKIHALDDWMKQYPLRGVETWVPAYASILVKYDPLKVTFLDVNNWVKACIGQCPSGRVRPAKQVEIMVSYGGEDGPDLAFVAEYHNISPAEVVSKHTAQIYRVGMMGFTPGFAYLVGLEPDLAAPRLSTPRTAVPAGSVGIAGEQTGIYPLESPGGWRLIGRTDRMLFDPHHDPYFLLSPGDEVRFVAKKKGGDK
jgi:KipI family sensor histidine kinase inhibitor